MRIACFLLLLLMSVSTGFSQNTVEVNSLKSDLATTQNKKEIALIHLKLAKAFQKSNRDSSRFYSDKAVIIAREIKDDSLLAASFFRQAYTEFYNSNDTEALTLYKYIDSLAVINGNLQKIVIETKIYRSEISKFTFTLEGVLQAKEYLLEGLSLAQESGDIYLENKMMQRLAAWHGFISQEIEPEKHLDTAKTILLKVLPYFIKENDLNMSAEVYESLGTVYERLKDFKKQNYYNDNLLTVLRKIGDSMRIGEAYYIRGASYRKQNNPKIGLVYLDSAKTIYDKVGYPNETEKKNLYRDYGYLYEQNGNYKKAYESMQKALVQSYTVYKDQNTKSAMEMEAKYENQKKLQEIALLQSQSQTAEAKRINQRNLLLGGIGLTSVAGIFLLTGYRNRKKTNDKLRELDSMKSSFFANISHEFRTPLSLIAGPIEEQLRKSGIDEKEKKNLEIAQRNSQRLVTLVDQLLDLSKLEAGHFSLKVQEGKLGTFLKSIASSFEYTAVSNVLSYNCHIEIENKHWFDRDMLEKIATNLISNAIKYSSKEASIEVIASVEDDFLKLLIKNTGTPLSKDELTHIFNRFYRANEEQVGSGIGLAHTKELVALHKGSIRATSHNGWNIFEVVIPVSEKAFSSHEKKSITDVDSDHAFAKLHSNEKESETTPIFKDKEFHLDKLQDSHPILLIVDDNKDLREYVSSLFQEDFSIVTEVNGKTGFAKALEVVPDLIITDLMMPEEDGLTFTKNCKSNEATSHIPILMLTAKAGDENELIGLETGADAYLTKPFSTEILKATVHNLQESRRILQERFSQEIVLLPKDIATNSIDEKFLENLQDVMDQQLVESDFNTEAFAKAVGMSRMQLHRKLKALTGLSATEFIRNQRLKLAAQLLKKSEINVSQVGYTVGFNNHSYFTKCFKEQYGCSPSEYIKKF